MTGKTMHTQDAAVQDDSRLNRTANILGALAIALSGRITAETSVAGGISPSAVSALIQVHFSPGVSVEQLRNLIGLSHSASVRVVDVLEGMSLIGRRRMAGVDARVTSLFTTDKGRDLAREVLRVRGNITKPIVASFSPDDQLLLERVLGELIMRLVRPGPEQEYVCRFCDLSECPQDTCPMTLLDEVASTPVTAGGKRS
jgi:DNA-binding MarR family transcriptional regulator